MIWIPTGVAGAGPVDAVVLAAGESRRMGRPKMLLPWDGCTVLEAVVRSLLAAPVRRVAVVLGHRADEHRVALRPLLRESRVIVVENPRYREGMLTSAQCGVAALGRTGARGESDMRQAGARSPAESHRVEARRLADSHQAGDRCVSDGLRRNETPMAQAIAPGAPGLPPGNGASPARAHCDRQLAAKGAGSAVAEPSSGGDPGAVLIALGDQPLITPDVVAAILAGHRGGLTVPTCHGRRGHPLCVDRSLLDDLLALPADEGLRGLFLRHPGKVTPVPVETDAILRDVDTPAEYLGALAERAEKAQACSR